MFEVWGVSDTFTGRTVGAEEVTQKNSSFSGVVGASTFLRSPLKDGAGDGTGGGNVGQPRRGFQGRFGTQRKMGRSDGPSSGTPESGPRTLSTDLLKVPTGTTTQVESSSVQTGTRRVTGTFPRLGDHGRLFGAL